MIAVTKTQRMLTSLIAAVPAAYLGLLLVMAMLTNSENLSMIAYVMLGITILCAAVIVLMPVGILLGGIRKPAAAKADSKAGAKPKKQADAADALDDDIEVTSGSSGSIESLDGGAGSSEFDISDSSQEFVTGDSEDAITTENLGDFEMDDDEFEVEEEVKPKSKKKR